MFDKERKEQVIIDRVKDFLRDSKRLNNFSAEVNLMRNPSIYRSQNGLQQKINKQKRDQYGNQNACKLHSIVATNETL